MLITVLGKLIYFGLFEAYYFKEMNIKGVK